MSANESGVSSSDPNDAQAVRGERAAALVSAAPSIQARVSNFLAAGLMIVLGVGALTWYYAHALGTQSQARRAAQSTAAKRAQGEMALPALGPIAPPLPVASPPVLTSAAAPSNLPLAEARSATPSEVVALRAKTPRELALERRLSGPVFAREAQTPGVSSESGPPAAVAPGASAPAVIGAGAAAGELPDAATNTRRASDRAEQTLSGLLTPTVTRAIPAQLLPAARFLLPKGAFIDCTLETAIDSTLPGMTTCVTAADTFGADGRVVLLERGTKLVGETRGQLQQGQARVFVLWTEARTPSGVIVPLESPGTDELGRAGLPGEVQRHFWQRFGAAILISLLDGVVQARVLAAAGRAGGAVVYAPSGAQDVATEVLKDTLRVGPTLTKRNGDRIQVLVARDLDFRSVYELRTTPGGH